MATWSPFSSNVHNLAIFEGHLDTSDDVAIVAERLGTFPHSLQLGRTGAVKNLFCWHIWQAPALVH